MRILAILVSFLNPCADGKLLSLRRSNQTSRVLLDFHGLRIFQKTEAQNQADQQLESKMEALASVSNRQAAVSKNMIAVGGKTLASSLMLSLSSLFQKLSIIDDYTFGEVVGIYFGQRKRFSNMNAEAINIMTSLYPSFCFDFVRLPLSVCPTFKTLLLADGICTHYFSFFRSYFIKYFYFHFLIEDFTKSGAVA